jgi:hypothetical protein
MEFLSLRCLIFFVLRKSKLMKNKDAKRLGRPQLGAEKRRFRIAASFTLEERNMILEVAEWCQLSPSEVLRRAALLLKIKPPPPKVNLEAIRLINEINKNFSLLLKRLEEDRTVDVSVADIYFRILAGLKSVIMESK